MTRILISVNLEQLFNATQALTSQNSSSLEKEMNLPLKIQDSFLSSQATLANREVLEIPNDASSIPQTVLIQAALENPEICEENFGAFLETLDHSNASSSSANYTYVPPNNTLGTTSLPGDIPSSLTPSEAENANSPTDQPLSSLTKDVPSKSSSIVPGFNDSNIALLKALIDNPSQKALKTALEANDKYTNSLTPSNLKKNINKLLIRLRNSKASDREFLFSKGFTQNQLDELIKPAPKFTSSDIIFIKALVSNPTRDELKNILEKGQYDKSTKPNSLSKQKTRLSARLKKRNDTDNNYLLANGITQDQIDQLTTTKDRFVYYFYQN